MSGTITKHRNALGWAWYLDTDEGSYWVSHPVKEHIDSLESENAKLRDVIKELVVGTHAEMCADRGMWRCRECVMYHGDESCAVADAMELLGIDMYGEPMEI